MKIIIISLILFIVLKKKKSIEKKERELIKKIKKLTIEKYKVKYFIFIVDHLSDYPVYLYIGYKLILLKYPLYEEYLKNIMKFSENNISIITDIFVFILGFYVALISIFISSNSQGIKKIIEENKETEFLKIILLGILSSFIILVFSLYYGDKNYIFYFFFFYLSIFNMLRIGLLVFLIFEENMKEIKKEMKNNIEKEKEEKEKHRLNDLKEHYEEAKKNFD